MELGEILTLTVTLIFIYIVFVVIIYNIFDYMEDRRRLLYYLDSMDANNFYRKWFFPNSFLKEIINVKITPPEKECHIFLRRLIFAAMKCSGILEEIKTYHVKTSYSKSKKVYSIRAFLVLNKSSEDFDKKFLKLKSEVFNLIRDNPNAVVFNVDIL